MNEQLQNGRHKLILQKRVYAHNFVDAHLRVRIRAYELITTPLQTYTVTRVMRN